MRFWTNKEYRLMVTSYKLHFMVLHNIITMLYVCTWPVAITSKNKIQKLVTFTYPMFIILDADQSKANSQCSILVLKFWSHEAGSIL